MMMDAGRAPHDVYGETLIELGRQDARVVILTSDPATSTWMDRFSAEMPDRFFPMGGAAAHMIGTAAGLALSGLRPFASAAAVPLVGGAWESIRQHVACPGTPVRIVAIRAGLAVGEDGAGHQMLEDIALMRALPNMAVLVPADATEFAGMLRFLAGYDEGPAYVRLSQDALPRVHEATHRFVFGTADVRAVGGDITLAACGQMVSVALAARDLLSSEGIGAEVINVSTVKPLDRETLLQSIRKTRCVVTIEDHQVIGGLGSAVCELLSEELPTLVVRVGVDDRFGQSGSAKELLRHYGLDVDAVIAAAKQAIHSVGR
jgi:transketolase